MRRRFSSRGVQQRGLCHGDGHGRDCGEPQLQVGGVSAVKRVDVVLDSGSDATIMPASFRGVGIPVNSSGQLWDAQGAEIKTHGCIELVGDNGEVVTVKDRGHISSHVAQPLISYRSSLKRGWTISLNSKNEPKLSHARSGVEIIPVGCKNASLVVSWTIRRAKVVRHVPADVPKSWSEKEKLEHNIVGLSYLHKERNNLRRSPNRLRFG